MAVTVLPLCGRAASAALMASASLGLTVVGWEVNSDPGAAVRVHAATAELAPAARLAARKVRRVSCQRRASLSGMVPRFLWGKTVPPV